MNVIKVGTLNSDGSVSETKALNQMNVGNCPFFILDFDHYREDGSCKCNDIKEQKRMIKEWGYSKKDFKNIFK